MSLAETPEPPPPGVAEPMPEGPRLTLAQVGWLLVLVVTGRILAARACPLYDDAFITFRYARNLADGLGMVFNPGAPWEPVLGTTTSGFTAFLSLLLRLGGEPTTTAIAANVVLDVASAVMLAVLLGRRAFVTTATLFLFAVTPQLARISVGGMESPFLVALLLAGALAVRARRGALAGLFVGIACTVRPEAVLFTAIFGLPFLRRAPGRGRVLAAYAGVITVIGVVSAGLLTHVYGSPIPQSVRAKSSTHASSDLADDLDRVGEILEQAFLPSPWLLPVLVLALLGVVPCFRRREGPQLVVAVGLAVVASYLAARPHTWGWYYYLPLVGWTILAGYGAEAFCRRLTAATSDERVCTILQRVVPALAVSGATAAALVIARTPDLVTERVYRPMEAFVRDAGIGPDTVLLASDIGAIAYFADCRVLDSEGLTWPGALEYKGDGPGMTNAQIQILDAERPEYVVFVAERPRLAAFRARQDLVEAYEPVARFNVEEDRELRPELDALPGHWKQDYLVLRRR